MRYHYRLLKGVHREFDGVVVGGGHNGLVAATLLARAGQRVIVVERNASVGGSTASTSPFPGVEVRLSRYSYLVSLFPKALLSELGLGVELRRRGVEFHTPGLALDALADPAWRHLREMLGRVAMRLFGTLTEPLMSRTQIRALVDDEEAWRALFEEPLSALIEGAFADDLARGTVLTDGLIGTFTSASDPALRQNRCFLYHVIGNGDGRWDVPVGGMGALTDALVHAARSAGVEIITGLPVTGVQADGRGAEVTCADGTVLSARHVLANVAPSVLSALVGEPAPAPPEGAQLKLNMVLDHLPVLREPGITPERAFAGTLHVNEGYEQLQLAYEQAAAGRIPEAPPCELYCHSLTDPSILGPELAAAGAQTVTVFGLHMPARLFAADPEGARARAVAATLRSIDTILAEPIEECLWKAPDGSVCVEALTPPELEAELAMPGGHIFHRDLSWPFAETEEEIGKWGVETQASNVWLCGAGARRGGGVSGIPGHNAARAVLEADARRR